jgi:hypothetical protein
MQVVLMPDHWFNAPIRRYKSDFFWDRNEHANIGPDDFLRENNKLDGTVPKGPVSHT